jgi:hypothetical protein
MKVKRSGGCRRKKRYTIVVIVNNFEKKSRNRNTSVRNTGAMRATSVRDALVKLLFAR